MPKPLKPIWTAEGQAQRKARRGKAVKPSKKEINHALGLCRKRRLGYRCQGRPGECD